MARGDRRRERRAPASCVGQPCRRARKTRRYHAATGWRPRACRLLSEHCGPQAGRAQHATSRAAPRAGSALACARLAAARGAFCARVVRLVRRQTRAPARSRGASGVSMPASGELTVDGVAKLTVPLLKAALQARGLAATGLKAELAERLVNALRQESCEAGAAADAAPAAEAAPAAAPAPSAAPASPAKPAVQPVAAPEPAPVVEQAPAPAPPAQPTVRLSATAPPRMRNPKRLVHRRRPSARRRLKRPLPRRQRHRKSARRGPQPSPQSERLRQAPQPAALVACQLCASCRRTG